MEWAEAQGVVMADSAIKGISEMEPTTHHYLTSR